MSHSHRFSGGTAARSGGAFLVAVLLSGCTSKNEPTPAGPSAGSVGTSAGTSGAANGGAPAGVSGAGTTVGGSGGATSSSAGSPGNGAEGVQCGTVFCAPPNSCCRARGQASATPSCVVACEDTQDQLCAGDADCQSSDTAKCINGVCVDEPSDAGVAVVDAGPVTFFDGGTGDPGTIPPGYPMPTAANYAKCQKVPVSGRACAGDPSSNVCIECLFGGSNYNTSETTPTAEATAAAGNYLVTVQLGGAAAGKTHLSTESSRGLLSVAETKAGESLEYAFAVNVRAMEGQPNHSGGPGGYPGLDLFFSGPASAPPQVSAIGYALSTSATAPITLFIASDSTTCDQTGGEYAGWGQMLPQYFVPPIAIANYANSGASSGSFFGSIWPSITSHWKAGDYVIVQFGHNDKGVSDATVQANLEKYITAAKAANVTAIVVSPPARVSFVGSVEGDQSSLHAAAAQKAAAAQHVAYIDLTALSVAWYNSLGSKAAAMKFHAGGTDATHTNLPGADKLASLVAGAIETQKLPLAQYLR